MTSLSAKLVLCILAIALLATPVFAKTARHKHVYVQTPQFGYIHTSQGYIYIPPPPELLYAPQPGNSYTPVYVPGFGNIGSETGYPGGGR